jgi:type II secretory pathway component PulM
MSYDLEDIELLELSLVDEPANQHASVVLFKRSGYNPGVKPEIAGEIEKGDGPVTVEELTKKLEALQAQVTDLTKQAADAEAAKAAADAALDALTKSAADAGLDVADGKIVKRADPEFVEIDGEKVEKSLVPAPVLKAIEKQAAEIAKMKAKAEEVEIAKRGEAELPNLAGTPLAKGRLLALVEKDADMLKSLKAADAAMAKAYQETGHARSQDEASATYKLNELAKAHASAQNVTFEVAYAEVTKSGIGAELLVQMRNEAN